MRAFCMVLLLWTLAGPLTVGAQSLADIARQEEARRKTVKDTGKVYTNKDLKPVAPVPPDSATSQTSEKAASPGDTGDAKGDSKAGDGKGKSPDVPEPPKDRAYWNGRMKTLAGNAERDQILLDALQSRINALTNDFASRDDPAQRAAIASARDKALVELDRMKKAVADDKTAMADLEEEARRSSVPPGWLR